MRRLVRKLICHLFGHSWVGGTGETKCRICGITFHEWIFRR